MAVKVRVNPAAFTLRRIRSALIHTHRYRIASSGSLNGSSLVRASPSLTFLLGGHFRYVPPDLHRMDSSVTDYLI